MWCKNKHLSLAKRKHGHATLLETLTIPTGRLKNKTKKRILKHIVCV